MGIRLRLVVVGQGYVGLPLAVLAAKSGYDVVGIDKDTARVERLRLHSSYVEDVPSEELRELSIARTYVATTSFSHARDFDVAVVTVPTPLRDGAPDLTYVRDSCLELAAHVRPGCTVILESTTYPGTTEEVVGPLLKEASGLTPGKDFHLGYSPERIDPGNRDWSLSNTPKVVAGIDELSLKVVQAFYDTLVGCTVPVSTCKAAELTKLLENTFRHVNIGLVNELAMVARAMGLDIWEIIDAAATKPFGFTTFRPGPGVGGHCLPIDPSYLSWRAKRQTGYSVRFVELANDVNEHMPEYVVKRVCEALNRRRLAVNGSRLLLLGLAYKRNTSDARESPAVRVAELLLDMGAEVCAVDDHVSESHVNPGIDRVTLSADEIRKADLIVLLTDHDNLGVHQLDYVAHKVFDTRNDPRLGAVERL